MATRAGIQFTNAHYREVMRKFGYAPSRFSKINFAIRSVGEEDLQRRWLCHHEADAVSKALKRGAPTTVSTGIGLSGEPHIGTISQIMRAIYLQKAGLDVNFVLGDLDAYNGKNRELAYVSELAGKYRAFALRLGFVERRGSALRTQYDALEVLRTMYLSGKYADDRMFSGAEEELHDFYANHGRVDGTMTYRRRLSLNLMSADFIHLLLQGYDNVLVMLGVDEHQYVLFARRLLENMQKAGEFDAAGKRIAGLYSPLVRGLYGHPKMSKSFPESSISVSTPGKGVVKALMDGEGRWDFPENNVVLQMMSAVSYYGAGELRECYELCNARGTGWARKKREYADVLIEILSKWRD